MIKKIVTLTLILTALVSSNIFASSARWQALGNEHRFIIDTTNYTVYPGRVHQFSNALFVIPVPPDFNNNNLACGILYKFTNDMTGAFHFNLPSAGAKNLNNTLGELGGNLAELEVRPWPDLFWGMKTGSTSIGARLALAMDSKTVNEKKASATALDLDVGATMFETPLGELDLGANVGIQSFLDEDADIESTGGFGVSFGGRLNMPLNNKPITLVPLISAKLGSDATVNGEDEVSFMGGDLGACLRLMNESKQMVIAGLLAGYDTVTTTPKEGDEVTATTLKAKVVAGAEIPIKKWLVVRGGMNAEKSMHSNDAKEQDVQFYYNTGIRFIYSGFIVDAILARNFFHRGPYLISGSGDDWATNVCITYLFGKK